MKKRVMVVDDSPLSRRMIARAINRVGDFDLVEIGSGSEAVKRYKEQPFDIVFLDLTMPELSGYDVIKLLKEYDPDICIVVVSADRQRRTAERLNSLGIATVLPKPPDQTVIRRALESIRGDSAGPD